MELFVSGVFYFVCLCGRLQGESLRADRQQQKYEYMAVKEYQAIGRILGIYEGEQEYLAVCNNMLPWAEICENVHEYVAMSHNMWLWTWINDDEQEYLNILDKSKNMSRWAEIYWDEKQYVEMRNNMFQAGNLKTNRKTNLKVGKYRGE